MARDEQDSVSFFRDAEVEYEGSTFRFSAEEGRALEMGSNYWHGPGDPSSWLGVAVFLRARERVDGAPESVALDLAARALGMTVPRLRELIEWHENYMRWHDGDPEYRVL
ncbi:MAG: hypothetical protein E3J64_00035 [Anaerolineales bacterium]|nr:MAG: hypothetical protein E3J64_00035 [Anaerolineales bacterium]